jgi:hypothetical protein
MEGSLVAYKVFTNGSVLNASEINDNLMNQSVMVFSNSTARAAALTAPVEGMLTWLEDVNRYEYRDGSGAWVELGVAPGLTHINTTSFSAVAAQSVNDVFSASYDHYKIVYNITTATASNTLRLRLRVGGADETANLYTLGQYYVGAFATNPPASTNNLTATLFDFAGYNTTNGGFGVMEIARPFNADTTRMTFMALGQSFQTGAGGLRNTTSYTGYSILANVGNITGSVTTYGYKRS